MLKTLDDIRARIITSYDTDRIILFGSRAAGTSMNKSDHDLLILKDTHARPTDLRLKYPPCTALGSYRPGVRL